MISSKETGQRQGRVRCNLTRVGKVFAALMTLFYAAAITSQSGLLLLYIGLMAGCFVVNWVFARRTVRAVEVSAPEVSLICEGSKMDQPWMVRGHPKKAVELLEVASGEEKLFRVPLIQANETLAMVPEMVFEQRGVYPNDRVIMVSRAPFGLVRAVRKLSLKGEVLVYPDVFETQPPAVSGLDPMPGGKVRGQRRVNTGASFAGVRGWQAGDPIKQIDWKSTAKRDELMVRVYDEELSGRVAVVIDAAGFEKAVMDDCVRAAGSLIFAGLDAGHQVEICDLATGAVRIFPAFADGTEILQWLARYEPVEQSNEEIAAVARKTSRRAAIALVTPKLRPNHLPFIQEMQGQGRRVSCYLDRSKDEGQEAAHSEVFLYDQKQIVALRETQTLSEAALS